MIRRAQSNDGGNLKNKNKNKNKRKIPSFGSNIHPNSGF
jgi:hypothetical protein